MNQLYPIIRRVRRPLLPPEESAPVVSPAVADPPPLVPPVEMPVEPVPAEAVPAAPPDAAPAENVAPVTPVAVATPKPRRTKRGASPSA